ncbi:MAG: hypothetical protein KKA07_07140 [Bacteroidetes bacterium]|nr:hypothetical protein [Bacteroidota bacterium]MBU1718834.1 hypothetical protein [Bacteroidota bacterium]
MRTTFLILLILAVFRVTAQETDAERAAHLADSAQILADSGNFDDAVKVWEQAADLDAFKFTEYRSRIAQMYYKQNQFGKTNKVMKKLLNRNDMEESHYLLTARSLYKVDDLKKSNEVLKIAQQKFPSSGEILYELGFVEMRQQKFRNATIYWEMGIKAQPTCASNYYGFARLYSNSPERLWSVFFGEIFLNIEREGTRFEEISKILFETYQNGFKKGFAQASSVNLPQTNEEIQLPFTLEFEKQMFAASDKYLKETVELDIALLIKIRRSFLERWEGKELHEKFPNQVIDFMLQLKDSGNWDAYNYWLFQFGKSDEFATWKGVNEDSFTEFTDWIESAHYEPDANNLFLRSTYVR